MKITIERLENLIKTAIASNADIADVQELKDHLDDLKSGKLSMSQPDIAFEYETRDADGTKVRGFSTAPISPDDDDDFEGVTFRKISHNN